MQDWILEKQFRQVPGVIDVVGFGGLTKQYHVEVDPYRLRGRGVALSQLQTAIANANQNVGGQRITLGEQSFDVRGVGLIRSVQDIGDITIAAPKGVPVRVRDVAAVSVGAAPRLGIVGRDDEPDMVEGIVLMRYGGDSLKTIQGIHDRVDYIHRNRVLPPGIDIEPVYDRADLVKLTTHTVMENLLVGMILVSLVLWLFLRQRARGAHHRAQHSAGAALRVHRHGGDRHRGQPDLSRRSGLRHRGRFDGDHDGEHLPQLCPASGGIGLRAHRRGGPRGRAAHVLVYPDHRGGLHSALHPDRRGGRHHVADGAHLCLCHRWRHPARADPHPGACLAAAARVRNAKTKRKRRAGSCAFCTGSTRRCFPSPCAGRARRCCWASCRWCWPWRRRSSSAASSCPSWKRAISGSARPCPSRFRSNSRPATWAACAPSCAAARATSERLCTKDQQRRPEVQTVISQLGRPDDGTDVSGFHNIELLAPLRPSSEWRQGVTKASMTEDMQRDLARAFPGVVFNFSQVISDNVEEAMSGVKGENTVKVVGPDLHVNETKADEIVAAHEGVRGVEDLGIFRSLGQPAIRITPSRTAAGRYGLNTGDVAAVIQAAIGGLAITQVYEGEKHFDLTVRWAEHYRRDLRAIRDDPGRRARRRPGAARPTGRCGRGRTARRSSSARTASATCR